MRVQIHLFEFYDLGGQYSNKKIKQALTSLSHQQQGKYIPPQTREVPDFIKYPHPFVFKIASDMSMVSRIIGKIYPLGALSLDIVLEFNSVNFADLEEKIAQTDLEKIAQEISLPVVNDLKEHLSKSPSQEEFYQGDRSTFYPIYCLSEVGSAEIDDFIEANQQKLASLLMGSFSQEEFSEQQLKKIFARALSYHNTESSILHWNAGLFIAQENVAPAKLYIAELANIHFLKLQIYDIYLDKYLSDYLAQSRLTLKNKLLMHIPGLKSQIKEITELKIEIEKIIYLIDQFEKFFGKWHLAQLYYQASNVFEIDRWKNLLEKRLAKITDLYNILHDDLMQTRMFILNILMLILFLLWFLGWPN